MHSFFQDKKNDSENKQPVCYIFLNAHNNTVDIKNYRAGFFDSYLIEKIKLNPTLIYETSESLMNDLKRFPDNGPETRYSLKMNCSKDHFLSGDSMTGKINGTPMHELILEAKPLDRASLKVELNPPKY